MLTPHRDDLKCLLDCGGTGSTIGGDGPQKQIISKSLNLDSRLQSLQQVIDEEDEQGRGEGGALRDAHTDIKREDGVIDDELGFAVRQECPDLDHKVAGDALALQLPQQRCVVDRIIGPLNV